MKSRAILLLLFLALSLGAWAQKVNIDADWQFHYGSIAYSGGNLPADIEWRTLRLPHDWSVESEAAQAAGGTVVGPFSSNSTGKYQTGHTVGGEGWYRRTFPTPSGKNAQRTELYFEGAYNQTDVWVNGRHAYWNPYGYQSFRFDITPLLRTDGGENELVVRVRNEGQNTRWYAGSGIYRHVWLLSSPTTHLGDWDTYVQAQTDGRVRVDTRLYNQAARAQSATLWIDLQDASGKVVSSGRASYDLKAGAEQEATVELQLPSAQLWSPASPYLYKAVLRLESKAGTHRIEKRFGVRSLAYDAQAGFRLNGEPTLLRGGCVHHDTGLLGAAAWDRAEDRKLALLKAQGFNAVRCSHNLPSEHFLDACDSLGLMVIDECFDQWLNRKNDNDYSQYFPQFSQRDLGTMLRRDRNHPSIIMWSIGNEIPGRTTDAGMQVAARLAQLCHDMDATRPVTAAVCGWDEGDAWNAASHNWEVQDTRAFESLDIAGYNYLYDKYEHDHGTHPQRVMCGLESYPKQASENWTLVEQLPYVIGDFVWTAMDYLGEAGIGAAREDRNPSMFQEWPYYNGWCGDIDLIGQKKPQSYYRDVVWRQRPVAMAVQPGASYNNAWGWQLEEQRWTWPGKEGEQVKVNVYSRAPQVRLYLNGKSMGDKQPGATFWAGYDIPYEAGTLRAVNLDAQGNELPDETFELQTTSEPAALRLCVEGEQLSADGSDLSFITIELVDAQGRVVTSESERKVSIALSGEGELMAAGNASPTDMASFYGDRASSPHFRAPQPALFRGRAMAIVRSTDGEGEVRLTVTSDGLEPQTATIRVSRSRN